MKGTARSQSMRSARAASSGVSAAVSNQRRSACHQRARAAGGAGEAGASALRGAGQWHNASAALMTVALLSERFPVAQQAVREGLLTAELPGRFQILPGRPLVILDVAHNRQAAAALADPSRPDRSEGPGSAGRP